GHMAPESFLDNGCLTTKADVFSFGIAVLETVSGYKINNEIPGTNKWLVDYEVESSSSFESPQPCRKFTLSEIQLATQNFDESLVIGRGGFGKVFKGTITSGTSRVIVAIKRLDLTSNQGAHEFWAEVKMLSMLRHCHLVSLIGYCNDGQEMILVYEYMPNGTLEDHLHKLRVALILGDKNQNMHGRSWLRLLHTSTGIHHGVITCDVQELDYYCIDGVGQLSLRFRTLDPDYFQTGRLTRKSDVYAFGVVLFEVLCGKRAVDKSLDEEQWGLARWAQDSIKDGRLKQIVDSRISGQITPKCLKKFARLADRCLDSHPKHRPTMAVIGWSRVCSRFTRGKQNYIAACRHANLLGRKGRLQNGQDIAIRVSSPAYIRYKIREASVLVKLRNKDFGPLLGLLHCRNELCSSCTSLHHFKLDHLIFDPTSYLLDWNKRYKIILGIARVLVYLHKHAPIRIIHGNLTSASILLDESFDPKLSNFWNATEINETDCMLNDNIRGKLGYVAPELHQSFQLSTKTDVHSFGLLVLETITGHRVCDFSFGDDLDLVRYVQRNWLEGTSSNIIDSRINVDSSSMTKFVEIGYCVFKVSQR
ncbi:kinase RLK-Pelle-CrRLK1L-1 family protein, partial [Tanacetum coccineum]